MDTNHSHPIGGTGAEVNCVLVLASPWGPSWVPKKTGSQLHPPCTSTALVQVQGKAGALLPWKQGQAEEHNQSLYSPTPAYLHRQSLNKPAGKQHSLGVKQHQKQSLEVQHEQFPQRLAQKHCELVRTCMAVGHKTRPDQPAPGTHSKFLSQLNNGGCHLVALHTCLPRKQKGSH